MVASALAEENLSSGPNYISSWSCSVSETREICGFLERKRKKVNRTLLKFGEPARQAIELPLIAMCQSESCWQQAPLVQGGPALPVATAVIGSALMFRGIQARSIGRSQVAVGKDELVVTIGVRKNCQHGSRHPRIMKFQCMFTTSDVRPHFLIKNFDELLGPRNFFFGSIKGLAVLESRICESLRRVGPKCGVGTPPHTLVGSQVHVIGTPSESLRAQLPAWLTGSRYTFCDSTLACRHSQQTLWRTCSTSTCRSNNDAARRAE